MKSSRTLSLKSYFHVSKTKRIIQREECVGSVGSWCGEWVVGVECGRLVWSVVYRLGWLPCFQRDRVNEREEKVCSCVRRCVRRCVWRCVVVFGVERKGKKKKPV